MGTSYAKEVMQGIIIPDVAKPNASEIGRQVVALIQDAVTQGGLPPEALDHRNWEVRGDMDDYRNREGLHIKLVFTPSDKGKL